MIPERRLKRRGLIAAGCLGAGIAVGVAWDAVPGWPLVLTAGVLAVAAMVGVTAGLGRRLAMVGLAAACVVGGAGWLVVRTREVPPGGLGLKLGTADAPARRLPVTVEVMVTEGSVAVAEPEGLVERPSWLPASLRARARVRAVLVGDVWERASGEVAVISPKGMAGLNAGERVVLTGVFTGVGGPVNPGQRDGRPWANQDGRAGLVVIDGPDAVRALDDERWRAVRWGSEGLGAIRGLAAAALERAFPAEGGADDGRARAMMRAMLLGAEDAELHQASGDLARLGLVHILSISGFHLAVLSIVTLWVLRLAGGSSRVHALSAAVATGLYMLVVPAEAPVLRSGFMVIALLLGEAAGRRYDRLNTLGWAAFVLLLWRPLDLMSAGFQLSFLTTGVLLWRGELVLEAVLAWRPFSLPGVKGRSRHLEPKRDGLADGVKRLLFGTVVVGVLAVGVSAPLVVLHTGMLPGWGVVVGIALTPLATVALVLGLVALPLVVWGWAGGALAGIAEAMCAWIFRAADAAGRLPGASVWVGSAGTPGVWVWSLVMTAMVLLLVARRPRWWGIAVVVAVAASLTLVLPRGSLSDDAVVQVDQLVLTRSNCAVVQTRGGVLLVDPGTTGIGAARVVQRAVWSLAGPVAETVLVTSAKPERFSLIPELVGPLGVRRVVLPRDVLTLAEQRPRGAQGRLVEAVRRARVEVLTYDPRQVVPVEGLEIMVSADGTLRLRAVGSQGWTTIKPVANVNDGGEARRTVISGGD